DLVADGGVDVGLDVGDLGRVALLAAQDLLERALDDVLGAARVTDLAGGVADHRGRALAVGGGEPLGEHLRVDARHAADARAAGWREAEHGALAAVGGGLQQARENREFLDRIDVHAAPRSQLSSHRTRLQRRSADQIPRRPAARVCSKIRLVSVPAMAGSRLRWSATNARRASVLGVATCSRKSLAPATK